MKKRVCKKILVPFIFIISIFAFFIGDSEKVKAASATCKYSLGSTTSGTPGVFTVIAENGNISTSYSGYGKVSSTDMNFRAFQKNEGSCELACPVLYASMSSSGRSVNYSISTKQKNGYRELNYSSDSIIDNSDCSNNNEEITNSFSCSYGDFNVVVYNNTATAILNGKNFDLNYDDFKNGCRNELWYLCYNDYCRISTTAVSGLKKVNYIGVTESPESQYDENGDKISPDDGSVEPATIETGEPMDCGTLKGSSTYKIIRNIFTWIQIAAPIMLIIFGVLDFGKAIASSDADAMKKAQSTFVKRVLIVAAIILLPFIMDLMFSLLDGIMGNDTCGIGRPE